MSYSIVLFSNLIFHLLEIIWTHKIFNNFSSCDILIFQMLELKFFLFSKLSNLTKLLIIANKSIIVLLVNYFGYCLIFHIRNYWNFLNCKFLGGIQNIEWSNVERPAFRNFKITNIKITKDELFFYLRIHFFVFLR